MKFTSKKHIFLFDFAPALGTLISFFYFYKNPISFLNVALFIVFWLITMAGMEVGLHRYFSHRSFKTNRTLKKVLAVLGCFNGQGNITSWVTAHRFHHQNSDKSEDIHTPQTTETSLISKFKAWHHSHIAWKWKYPNLNPLKYSSDIIADSDIQKISSRYYFWALLGLFLPSLIGLCFQFSYHSFISNLLLGGFVRLFLCQNLTYTINSFCHMASKVSDKTKDYSKNIYWLALPSLGATYHKNHHENPKAACNSKSIWEIDPSYWLILAFEKLNWAHDVDKSRNKQ